MNLKQISAGALAAVALVAGGWWGGAQTAKDGDPQYVAVSGLDAGEPYGIGLEAQCNGTPIVCVPSYLFTPTPIVPLESATPSRTPTRTPTGAATASPTGSAAVTATPTQVTPAAPTFTPTATNTSACTEYPCMTDVDFTYEVVRRVALCFTAAPCGSGDINADRYRFRDVGERVEVQCLVEYTRGGNLWANEHPCSINPNGRWSAVIHNGITYMKFIED